MFANKCEGVLLCELCACGCVDQVVGLSAEGECVSRVGFGCLVSVHLGGCVNQGEVPFCSGLPQWLSGRIHLQCRRQKRHRFNLWAFAHTVPPSAFPPPHSSTFHPSHPPQGLCTHCSFSIQLFSPSSPQLLPLSWPHRMGYIPGVLSSHCTIQPFQVLLTVALYFLFV